MIHQTVRQAFMIPKVDKSVINEMMEDNLFIRLAFAELIPQYVESKYRNDSESKQKCINSVAGRVILAFPPHLQQNPNFRLDVKTAIEEVMNDQIVHTPEYINVEYEHLKGRLKFLINIIDVFRQKTESSFIKTTQRYRCSTQSALITFKQNLNHIVNEQIDIFQNIDRLIQIDTSFSIGSIRNSILKMERNKGIIQKRQMYRKNTYKPNTGFGLRQSPPSVRITDQQTLESPNKLQIEHLNRKKNDNNQNSIQNDNSEPVNERVQIQINQENSEDDNKNSNPIGNPDFDVTTVMDSETFVFHILSVGITPTQAIRFLNHLGIKCFSSSMIYYAQNNIAHIIKCTAEESMNYRKFIMPNGVRITFDGAWSHVRNSFQHTAVFIESINNKIIAAKCLYKDYRCINGNYENNKPGNQMEIEALILIKNELLDNRINAFTSDGDIKIVNLIKKLKRDPPLIITKDPGHIIMSIIRTLKKLSKQYQNIFQPLIKNFEIFLKSVVMKITDADLRVNTYKNIAAHYAGDHDPKLCIHNNDSFSTRFFDITNPSARTIFENFLTITSKLIRDVHPDSGTQINESFNHHCKKFINKLYAFRGSYSIRTAIAILDWNEKYFIFEILKRINSTQQLSKVFINSIKSELIEKEKASQRRKTPKWKEQHVRERLKRRNQSKSESSTAHQTYTIIKEAIHLSSQKNSQKIDTDEDLFCEEEYSSDDDDWHNELNESSLKESESFEEEEEEYNDDDIYQSSKRYKCLLNEEQLHFLLEEKIYIKHPASKTCGLKRPERNCFINAPLQLFSRINRAFVNITDYIDFFESLTTSINSIPIESKLLNKERETFPGEEDALFAVNFLICEFSVEELVNNNYFILFEDSVSGQIEKQKYIIKTAVDTSFFKKNQISSREIFEASIISQIGNHNNFDNIITVFPPPLLFIELWRYHDTDLKCFNFDDFDIIFNEKSFYYHCIGALIHIGDHFKSIAFDNDHIILLDDEMVADLSVNNKDNHYNAFIEIELQDLQYHSIMLVFQKNDDQIEEYISMDQSSDSN